MTSLAGAQSAIDRGDWPEARRQLDQAGDSATTPAGVELRALAAYGNGDLDGCLAAWEELHALHNAAGDRADAARAAAMLAMFLMMDTGLMAPVRGWLRRAERLVDGTEEVPAHALIAMTRTYERLLSGDVATARLHAPRAIELGERLGVMPAVVIGRVAMARVLIFDGQVEEGLDLLDEVCALLMSGSVDALTTGMMYCELICAAQGLALLDRATEWTDVMERWRHGVAFGGINGRCRVHRAELLRMSGPCDAAEEEALGACEELRPWMRREFGWPLVELGNIRLRKGDLDGADDAFTAAHDRAWSPQPGLALLRLAQGDIAAASALIEDAIAHPADIPWKERPPFGDLQLAPLLDAQVEIAAAAGDVETVCGAAHLLREIADTYSSRGLQASAALAEARAALLEANLDVAIERSSEAVAIWTELGAPFDAAMARLVLADGAERSGNSELAALHRRSARSAFESFGAVRHVQAIDQRLSEGASRSPTAGAADIEAAFRLDGDMRMVSFGGQTKPVRDLKGYRYLARLLAEPDREFHALDLITTEQGLPVGSGPPVDRDLDLQLDGGDGLPVLDDEARESYRKRLVEVDEDIEEARRSNDIARLALAERDREFLVAELASAAGIGGRHRLVGGHAERARTSVTRTIRYALKQLAEHHPDAAAHLAQRVQTGTYCSYRSDPVASVTWKV